MSASSSSSSSPSSLLSSVAPDDSSDDALSLTSHVGSFGVELEHDAHETVHEFEGFFTHYMGHMFLFLCALVISLVAGYVGWRVCRALLTAYGLAESRRFQMGMIVAACVVYLGMSAGFAVLGLNFTSIVITLSVLSIGFSAAVTTWLANLGGGFNMRSKRDVRLGMRLTTYYGSNEFSGVLVALHTGFSEIEMAPEPGTGYARRLYMPNRILDDGPLVATIVPLQHAALPAALPQQRAAASRVAAPSAAAAAASAAATRHDQWMVAAMAAAAGEHGQYAPAPPPPHPPVPHYLNQGRELFPGASQHALAVAAAAAADNGFALGGSFEKQLALADFSGGNEWGGDVAAADLAAAFMPSHRQ